MEETPAKYDCRGGAGSLLLRMVSSRPDAYDGVPDREFVSMPELPDVTVYVEAIEARLGGQPLSAYAILSPFILRTVEPPFIS